MMQYHMITFHIEGLALLQIMRISSKKDFPASVWTQHRCDSLFWTLSRHLDTWLCAHYRILCDHFQTDADEKS